MLPTPSDLHVNRPLTNMSVAFMQSLAKFQADRLAPVMPSDFKSNLFFKLNKEFWFSDVMKQRGVGAPAIRQGYGVSQDSFLCDVYALGSPIDDQQRANQDSPLDVDRTAMKFVTRAALMNREKAFKSAFWGTGKWTTDLTGNTAASAIGSGTFKQWDQATATPIDDVGAAKMIMEKLTGFEPNVLVMGREVWEKLKICPQILNLITGGSNIINPAQVTKELVARLLEVEEIVVLSSVENTAGHGNTMTGNYIFGKQMLLMYRDRTVGLETPTACRTITWKQYAGNASGIRIMKWRDESIHSDVIEIESSYVHKIVAADMGIFWNSAVA